MNNKKIFAIDMALIVGTLFVIIAIVGYSTPLVISPINNLNTTTSEILFSIKNADTLLIDDNMNFSSPEKHKLTDKLELRLEPGIYYWKAVGILQSEIRTLTIETAIILELRQNKDGYNVVNAGNVALNVDVYNQTQLVDQLELSPAEETKSNGNKFEGEMK